MTEDTGNVPATSDEPQPLPPPSTAPTPDEPAPEPVEEAKSEDTQAETLVVEEEPKKSSGYARLKARHQATIAEKQALEAEIAALKRGEPPEDKEPKVEDFNGDYLAFEKAAVAYTARKTIREELGQIRQQDFQQRQAEAQQENLQDFFERTEAVKTKLKDFDESIDALYGQIGALNPNLRNLIAEADNGPLILYQLAKNPGFARDLNAQGPLDQAKEIGKLEARLSLPRKETKAPPPITPPKGGAAQPADPFRLAKSDDASDYIAFRRKQMEQTK